MSRIIYNLSIGGRRKWSKKQKFLCKLYTFPFVRKIIKKPLKNSYSLGPSVNISSGFKSESIFLQVGKNTDLSNLYIHGSGEVKIGDFCSISSQCQIITGSHDFTDFNKAIVKSVIVEDYVWISTGAKVLDGVRIGRGAIVGAFSLVKSNVPPYAIVMGNPCKVVGFRFTVDEMMDFEKEHFEDEDRISEEKLRKNYDRYFLRRVKQIKEFISI